MEDLWRNDTLSAYYAIFCGYDRQAKCLAICMKKKPT